MKERAISASTDTAPQSAPAAKTGTAQRYGLQRGGNLAVQRLLRGGTIQARRDQSSSPDEMEAEQTARRVVHSQGSGPSHGGCSCGRTTCPKCAAKRAAQPARVQTKEKPSATSSLDLDNAAAAVASLTGGSPLAASQRAFFEPRFGADFGGVRIHTGAEAESAADRLQARAFTFGPDIVFGRGEYQPDSTQGRLLLAHELTHVMQQEAAPAASTGIQRAPKDDYSDETYPQFVQRVRDRAVSRLDRNIGALDEWSSYISGMNEFQLGTQMIASNIRDYAGVASVIPKGEEIFETFSSSHHSAESRYAEARLDVTAPRSERNLALLQMMSERGRGYFTTPSTADFMQTLMGDKSEVPESTWVPGDFRYHNYVGIFEAFQSGRHGGCQTCHDFNAAWQKTIEEFGDPMPTGPAFPAYTDTRGAFLLGGGFSTTPDFTRLAGTDEQALMQYIAMLTPPSPAGTTATTTTTTSTATTSPPGFPGVPIPESSMMSLANPFLPSIPLPATVEAPIPRSSLCGEPPTASAVDPLDLAPGWGPGSAIVADAVRRIGGVLTPLGPRGYQVLPHQTFQQLWNATPDQLDSIRDSIIENIRTRQDKYRELQSEIRSGGVPFTELCPIIDELLPTTNEPLRDSVETQVKVDRAIESVIDTLLKIAGAAMLVFAIVFPPSIMLSVPMIAAGAGLALVGIATGARDFRRGGQYELGIGSGIYTKQQEAMAESLRFWGAFTMLANAISLGRHLRNFSALGEGASSTALVRANSATIGRASSATGPLPADARIAGVIPGTRATVLEDGRTLIWHPDHANMMGILDDQALTIIQNGQIIGRFPVPAAGTAGAAATAGSEGAGTAALMRSLPGSRTPVSLLPAPPVSQSLTPMVGGVSRVPGPLVATPWNPLGLNTNCGFCTISGLLGRRVPDAPITDADQLYIATVQGLGLPTGGTTDPISRQLIFPSPTVNQEFGQAAGYEALFQDLRTPSMYTFSQVAGARGLQTVDTPETFRQWQLAFNSGPVNQAAQRWVDIQEELGREVTLQQATSTINRLRDTVQGDYAIGTLPRGTQPGHYMGMQITPNGEIIGLDFQDGRIYLGLDAILGRMNGQIDMIRRVSQATTP